MRETANDVDIYWESEIEGSISNVIVLCSQEPCPIPNILTESLKEEGKVLATVFSKLDRVQPFFESDSIVGTKIIQYGDKLVVNFRGFHPIVSGNHWLFGYPVVREAIESILDKTNVDSLTILTSTIYTSQPNYDEKKDCTYYTMTYSEWANIERESKEVLPLFAYMTGWLSSIRDIPTTIVLFKAALDNIMTQQMFADGVGLFQILSLPVNIKEAQELYDEHESEVGMITSMMSKGDVSSGGMFS